MCSNAGSMIFQVSRPKACSALNREQIMAMPCNLVRMLQVGVQRDMPSFSEVQVQEEELCQPVVCMTDAAAGCTTMRNHAKNL
eukprot:6201917-Pleurochrysis_carterae.AAC.1